MAEPGPVAEALGKLAFAFVKMQPLIPTYLHLVLSALFPIYAGSHASLSRPSSAAKPPARTKTIRTKGDEEDDSDEDEDQIHRMEGLSPTDALMFPILAGCTLTGLYLIIKWLKDPALLNKIINWYFAAFGAISVAKLVADALSWSNNMVFPNEYVSGGALWQVKSRDRCVVPATSQNQASKSRISPLPGFLGQIRLPSSVSNFLWRVREVSRLKWTVKLHVQHLVSGKTHIGINGAIGTVVAILTVMYFNLVDKPWWLTNLMGFGFSYGALQLMSPTTFTTGALILSALFFYDIYFVFYT